MKICFVSQPFDDGTPPIEIGSIQIWTYQVALILARDHDVTICAKRKAGETAAETTDRIRWLRFGTAVDRWLLRGLHALKSFSKDPRRPEHASVLYYLGYLLQVAWHVRREGYDVVHVHNYSQFVRVVRWLNPRVPIVLHMQGEWLTQLHRPMIRRRLAVTDLVLGCSDYLMSKLGRAIPAVADRTQVVFNGVDPSQFEVDDRSDREGRPVEILFVGRHSPEKGVHDLLDAVKILVDEGRDVHATIVGPKYVVGSDMIVDMSDDDEVLQLQRFYPNGPGDQETYLAHLEAQRGAGLEKHVEFTGSIPHSELSALYRRADILTNPSLSETFGIALVEAAASGIPAVVTRVGGMPEIVVDGETGFVVEPDAPKGLAAAFDALVVDADLRQRMGAAGRRRVESTFTWERIAQALIEAYHRIPALR